ncbi:2-aminoethylphosphonate--pyruvate transaminase-like [Patiria miniata]|uniref:Alanine--glyoxylate aminotransferase n=1 Tax=Patiria miniata TaxID=46514 RepID=A0A914BER7_PATMI|nr:2-aminoethylphosphonate--pyruvate transaminase-like [Patiria miniata]XP_038074739.1 2-aminoethylphosphonate--pyruvate transaminase-like [Patiria miniata]XP_038074740.1 2-aminoethylphosphonate--pyruvate transaminase-like [Patiria miniata]
MREKKLFTPGPLGVSLSTKQAMLVDLGSRDLEFIQTVKSIRSRLVELAGVSSDDYTCVPVQGSGTFAIEAVFTSTIPRTNGKVLVLENGAYGRRFGQILKVLGVDFKILTFLENEKVDVGLVEETLRGTQGWTNVAVVHCETSSGVINPIGEIGRLVKECVPDASYFVDAMSSFGAVDIDFTASKIDFLVSSANKCLEGVPGFSYAICRKDKLTGCKGWSRSLSLDLVSQWETLEQTGQFRFTPPTHCMLAFKQALTELEEEGGISERRKRYKENNRIICEGMKAFGFKTLLDDTHDGFIITSFHYPQHDNFNFKDFYTRLQEKDQVIYPGKVTKTDCFRIGNIGHVFPRDMRYLLQCVQEVCSDMGIPLPLKE